MSRASLLFIVHLKHLPRLIKLTCGGFLLMAASNADFLVRYQRSGRVIGNATILKDCEILHKRDLRILLVSTGSTIYAFFEVLVVPLKILLCHLKLWKVFHWKKMSGPQINKIGKVVKQYLLKPHQCVLHESDRACASTPYRIVCRSGRRYWVCGWTALAERRSHGFRPNDK